MNAPDRPLLTNEHPLLALARFGEKCLDAHREEFADLGGDWLQEAAVECGLLKEVEVTEACDPENCRCAEYGDFPQTCYKLTEKAYLIEPPAPEPGACAYIGAPRGKPDPCILSAGHSGPHKHAPGASRDASPPYHVDATGMTREPPHCPTCDCGTPADLVGALQDVVHTDPGPVRAGKAVRDTASKKWSVERLGIIKQTPRQASIDDIEWLCEEVERLQAGILYEVENASLAPSARIRMRTLAIGTHESEKPGYHCGKLKADCDDEFCPTHGHDIR